jgi:ubiquinone/menaquinone biosynthesis C-methylase UbiE
MANNPKIFYDNEAQKYDDKRWSNSSGQYTREVQLEIVRGMVGSVSASKILEIGPGTGRFTSMLMDKAKSVTALDISSQMLRKLEEKVVDSGNKMETVVGDARNMPFSDNSFDCIVSINAISHIPNYEELVSECSRVIQKGGEFIFNIPNLFSLYMPYAAIVNMTSKSVRRKVFTKWYKISEVKKTLRDNGFEVSKVKGHVHAPIRLPSSIVKIVSTIDRLVRDGAFKEISPIMFFVATKV